MATCYAERVTGKAYPAGARKKSRVHGELQTKFLPNVEVGVQRKFLPHAAQPRVTKPGAMLKRPK